jgi:hypothetical protein
MAIGNCERAIGLLVLAVLAGSLCVPQGALAQPAAGAGCAAPPASPRLVSVRDTGAKGDGKTDETAAIQRAIDQIGSTGGTVFVPDGTYMVDAVGQQRLRLKGRMTFKLAPGAVLKTIPNGEPISSLLSISAVSHVTVVGGTLLGDRAQHLGSKGEWGMGIRIDEGAEHITVSNVTIKDMWGDGVFIEEAKDVTLCHVVADHNRRQGLSIIDADGVLVTHSVFRNTRGTAPSAGIDLEPYKSEQRIDNVRIVNSRFLDNAGPGVLISGSKGANNIANVEVGRNFFRGSTPVKIKYAPGVLDTAICRNRYVVRLERPTDLATVAGGPEEVVMLAACGDPGLRKRQ